MAPTGGRSETTRRIDDTLRAAAAALARLPDGAPRLEAELLLAEATGWPRTRLLAWPERTLEPVAAVEFDALLARRLAGEPIAYIRGRQAFWTLDLLVTGDTLIPRPADPASRRPLSDWTAPDRSASRISAPAAGPSRQHWPGNGPAGPLRRPTGPSARSPWRVATSEGLASNASWP